MKKINKANAIKVNTNDIKVINNKPNDGLSIFNNDTFGEVKTNTDENGKIFFCGSDVAKALGYKNVSKALSDHCKGITKRYTLTKGGNQLLSFITEGDVYRLIISSKLPSAQEFEKWIFDEIMPQLRQTGVVILDNATDDAIDFEKKFGTYRIRKTFNNSTNILSDYEEFIKLAKISKLNNTKKIKLNNIICDTLQTKIKTDVLSMKPSQIISIQETISDIKDNIIKLSNNYNGGKKAYLTKTINNNKKLISKLIPNDEDFVTLPIHGFSENSMYQDVGAKCHKTYTYLNWIKKFQEFNVSDCGASMHYKVEIFLKFTAMAKFDGQNLTKSAIDQIFNSLQVDDSIVSKIHCEVENICDNYDDGKIRYYIRNIEEF